MADIRGWCDERFEPLRELMRARQGVVRATATESLGAYADGRPKVQAALIASLDDPEPSVRVAAVRALVRAEPSPAVRAALDAHDLERHKATFGTDDLEYARALRVARLIQEGDTHWDAIAEGLADTRRYERAAWWHLLGRALRLPVLDYNPQPQPRDGTPAISPDDVARILETLSARRTS